MRISDWSSDVCSSDLRLLRDAEEQRMGALEEARRREDREKAEAIEEEQRRAERNKLEAKTTAEPGSPAEEAPAAAPAPAPAAVPPDPPPLQRNSVVVGTSCLVPLHFGSPRHIYTKN